MEGDASLVELSISHGTEKLTLHLPRCSTIARVKDELSSITGSCPPDQLLIHSSRKLTDGSLQLSELGPTPLRMMLICKGGATKAHRRQPRLDQWLQQRVWELLEALWILVSSFFHHLINAPEQRKDQARQSGSSKVDLSGLAACGALGGG
mmetsp:Transcript_36118/g.82958  ORF Transcript_36118/g.82958 Transcript_36118/m.82958 type:complete len:151 (+) Transcript_36118:65-517(+)